MVGKMQLFAKPANMQPVSENCVTPALNTSVRIKLLINIGIASTRIRDGQL